MYHKTSDKIKDQSREKRRQHDGSSTSIDADDMMSPRDKFKKNTFLVAIGNLSAWLKRRKEAYTGILDIFECLYMLDEEKTSQRVSGWHWWHNKVRTYTFEIIFKKRRNITGKDI